MKTFPETTALSPAEAQRTQRNNQEVFVKAANLGSSLHSSLGIILSNPSPAFLSLRLCAFAGNISLSNSLLKRLSL
jgi:hypothetical protein